VKYVGMKSKKRTALLMTWWRNLTPLLSQTQAQAVALWVRSQVTLAVQEYSN